MKILRLLSILSFFLSFGNIVSASLILSEVLIDGTDEFIEIYNSGEEFSGSIILEGVKSVPLLLSNVIIPYQGIYLLGDNGTMLQGVSLQKSGLSLNLIDTNSVSIILKDGNNQILDVFNIDQLSVQQSDNKKTSFQKYFLDGNLKQGMVSGNQIQNTVAGFTINPGIFLSLESSLNQTTIESNNSSGYNDTNNTQDGIIQTGTTTTGSEQQTDGGLFSSGNEDGLSGDQNTETTTIETISDIGIVDTGVSNTSVIAIDQQIKINIHELHPANDEFFKEYLELYFETPYSGALRIYGAGYGSAEKTIFVHQKAQSRLLLAGEDFGFGNIIVPGFSLTDAGESLIVVGQDGQVLDMVVYNGHVAKKSLYRGGVGEGGKVIMDEVGIMTPGYSKEQVKHLLSASSGYILPCGIDFQNRIPRYAGTSMNVAALWNEKVISNSDTTFVCQWKIGTGIISNVCNPNYLQISGAVLDVLNLDIYYEGDLCSVSIPLNIPEKISSSAGSSSATIASRNYYTEYQLWKDKFNDLLRNIRLLGFDLSTSKLLNMEERILSASIEVTETIENFSGSLYIDAILPNPKGKDTLESLRLISSGDQIISGVYVSFENKIFPLATIFLGDGVHLFTTGFGFPNKGTCIQLKLGSTILDSLCYPKTKEGKRYTHTGMQDGEGVYFSGYLGLLTIKQTTKEVCIYDTNTKVLCEDLDWSKKDEGALKRAIKKMEKKLLKQEKTILRLETKLDEKDEKIESLKEKILSMKDAIKLLRLKFTDQRRKKDLIIKDIRKKNSLLKEDQQLQTQYIKFLDDLLYDERSVISKQGFQKFTSTRMMYRMIQDSLKQGTKKSFIISPYIQGNSRELLALAQGEISESLLKSVYPYIYKNLQNDRNQIQKNISDSTLQNTNILVKLGKK